MLVLQHGAPEIQRVITIEDPSPAIDGQHAIGITIEGEAHGRSTVDHRLAKRGQLRGPTSNIDPGAVRFPVENRQVGAESPEALLTTRGRRSPAEVEHDRHTLKATGANRRQQRIAITTKEVMPLLRRSKMV